jgi:hypothetical protein
MRTVSIAMLMVCIAAAASARPSSKHPTDPSRVLVIDGSPVHDVGQLHLHTSNWGLFGSLPGAGMPFSHAPSAEWPAGSGVEYLFAGGLWIGAIEDGVPAVSTAAFSFEFRPTDSPVDVVYRSSEGVAGGRRLPARDADDDGDGTIDEDPLDGRDNDGDGKIDEDFAAVSDQMLARWYTDDQAITMDIYPDHRPMNLMVREHSYQWGHPDYDDFVGVDYEIANTGDHVLEDVYVGVFFDPDVGRRGAHNYWTDDGTGFVAVAMPGGGSYDFAYGYDVDGNGGTANGYFGVAILDHPTDPSGATAPMGVGAVTYASFRGSQSFEDGGDPTNDFERYELMASETIEQSTTVPADFRVMVCAGPFAALGPGEAMTFSIALVATPRDGDFANVVNAATVFEGEFFDVDGDPTTGQDGKEYQAHWWLPGQEPPGEPMTAQMRVTPRAVNPGSMGEALKARVTLPGGYGAGDVDEATLMLNDSIHGTIRRVVGDRTFVAQFSRGALIKAALVGEMELRVSFEAAGQPFIAVDRVRVVGGNGPVLTGAAGALRATASPNPFNPTTRIAFELPRDADVSLEIYSADGTLVRRLVSGAYPAGSHGVTWSGRDDAGIEVASGIYFYRLRALGDVVTKKMVLIK